MIMLALLFRGVFLVGIIGWYSASLWKAVDNYFKGQFQRYLEEEYQRNPRMREDVRAYSAVDTVASDFIAKTQQKLLVESGGRETVCPVDRADLAPRKMKSHQDVNVLADFGAGAAEIEVVRPAHTDLPAFQDSPVEEAVSSLAESYVEILPSTAIQEYRSNESSIIGVTQQLEEKIPVPKQKQQRKVEGEELKIQENQSPPKLRKKSRAKGRPKIEAKLEVLTKRKIKQRQKIPILKLTDSNFEEAARFFEFDDENSNHYFVDTFEDDDEGFNGIPLKDLPFKPMIDVYDLESVSEEEYCPLSLDDDPTCDELRSWA